MPEPVKHQVSGCTHSLPNGPSVREGEALFNWPLCTLISKVKSRSEDGGNGEEATRAGGTRRGIEVDSVNSPWGRMVARLQIHCFETELCEKEVSAVILKLSVGKDHFPQPITDQYLCEIE